MRWPLATAYPCSWTRLSHWALVATAGPAGADGAAAVVSFNGNKIITTSGGGALLCDDADMAERVRYLATQARQPVAHYEHVDIGFNYRLSNLLAAVGRAQLARLRRCWSVGAVGAAGTESSSRQWTA